MIYSGQNNEDCFDENLIDSNRFTVPRVKLEMFKRPGVKKLGKLRFVTGQASD